MGVPPNHPFSKYSHINHPFWGTPLCGNPQVTHLSSPFDSHFLHWVQPCTFLPSLGLFKGCRNIATRCGGSINWKLVFWETLTNCQLSLKDFDTFSLTNPSIFFLRNCPHWWKPPDPTSWGVTSSVVTQISCSYSCVSRREWMGCWWMLGLSLLITLDHSLIPDLKHQKAYEKWGCSIVM